MNAMLGQHPQAFGLPELCLFNVEYLMQMWVRTSDEMGNDAKTRHGLLRAVAEIYSGEQTMDSVKMATHWCAARQGHSTAQVYQELVAKIHPLVAVEKSPAYTIDIKRLRSRAEYAAVAVDSDAAGGHRHAAARVDLHRRKNANRLAGGKDLQHGLPRFGVLGLASSPSPQPDQTGQ